MDIVIYLAALGFAAMGVGALVAPGSVPKLFGISPIGADMANEVRAVYGGFGCAVAALLVLASQHSTLKTGIVVTIAISLLGMAAGRVISFVLSRTCNFYPVLFFFVELLFGMLLLWVGYHHGSA